MSNAYEQMNEQPDVSNLNIHNLQNDRRWTAAILLSAVIDVTDSTINWITQTVTTPYVPKTVELLLNELKLLRDLFLILESVEKDVPEPQAHKTLRLRIIMCGNMLIECGDSFINSSDRTCEFIGKVQDYRRAFLNVLTAEPLPDPYAEKVPQYPNLLVLLTTSGWSDNQPKLKALHDAASQGNTFVLQNLLRSRVHFDIEGKNADGLTALHLAAARGNKQEVRILLKKFSPAGIGAVDNQGRTALHVAMAHRHPEGIVAMLINNGIDISARTNDGLTALHMAAYCGDGDVVFKLLQCGAEISPKTCHDVVPLHLAAACGSIAVVKLLCRKGASLFDLTVNNLSPLHVAVKCGRETVVKYLLKKILEDKSIVEAEENTNIALYIALNHGNIRIVKMIMENRKKISLYNTLRYKATALYIATYKEYHWVAERLNEEGARLCFHGVVRSQLQIETWMLMHIKACVQILLEKGSLSYQQGQKHMSILLL